MVTPGGTTMFIELENEPAIWTFWSLYAIEPTEIKGDTLPGEIIDSIIKGEI